MFDELSKKLDDLFIDLLIRLGKSVRNEFTLEELNQTKYSQEAGEIREFYKKQDLPEPRIFLTDRLQREKYVEVMPNAATSPFGYNVFVTEGLFKLNSEVGQQFRQKYDKSFLEYVFAHEIGHLNLPTRIDTFIGLSIAALGCSYLAKFRPFKNLFKNQNKLFSFAGEFASSALALNYLTHIPVNMIRQQNEFHADRLAAEQISPEGYADALKTIDERAKAINKATPLTSNKVLKRTIRYLLEPIPDHPSTDERIKRLEQMSIDNKIKDCLAPS